MPGIQMHVGISQVKQVNYWPHLRLPWLWTGCSCGVLGVYREVYDVCVFVEWSHLEICP